MGTPKSGDVLLLKADSGGGVFVTIAGLRATSVSINGAEVNVTDKDSQTWRELLDGAGEKSLSISADGVWETTGDEQEALRAAAISGALKDYQIDDNDNIIECAFQVTSFEISGDQTDAQFFSITLESSGIPAVTPVA